MEYDINVFVPWSYGDGTKTFAINLWTTSIQMINTKRNWGLTIARMVSACILPNDNDLGIFLDKKAKGMSPDQQKRKSVLLSVFSYNMCELKEASLIF